MNGKSMSLKARLRNRAKLNNIHAQALLQAWMFRRFLSRLEKSAYKDRFILKGGVLISAWVGIDRRTTMDMDMTVRGIQMEDAAVLPMIHDICSIDLMDGVNFSLKRTEPIRDDAPYVGCRIFLSAFYDVMEIPFFIDVTTGDAITPKPRKSRIKCVLDESLQAVVWAYPIETVLAEKVETILSRGVSNTRPRDFYDVFILTATQPYDKPLFKKALAATTKHRGSEGIISEAAERITAITNSRELQTEWERYRKIFHYAADITYEQTIAALKKLCGLNDTQSD